LRRASLQQELCIAGLMIVHGVRERYQHRADARRGQFRNRQRPRPAHDQVRPAIGFRYVVDEFVHLRTQPGSAYAALVAAALPPGLVARPEHSACQPGDGFRQHTVECAHLAHR
jgi:hypothetical protein